jgi:hypothetical protein
MCGGVSVTQPLSGHVVWDVMIDIRVFGMMYGGESFREHGGCSERQIERAYLYFGTGGTTHGSRGPLHLNSEFQLNAQAWLPPAIAVGSLTCIVK